MSFTTDHRKLLYLTFVRSYIGYASEVWAPSTIDSITKIESLQRRATKFILNTHWQEDISYHERLSRLNLLPLTNWNEVKDFIFLFQVSRWPLQLTHRWLKLFQFSYFNSIAKLWNAREPDLNPLVLLLLLITLNLTYSNAILLLIVQTMTSLTLTPGSRSAANAVTWLTQSSVSWQLLLLRLFIGCGSDSFLSFLEIGFYSSHNVLMFS